MTLGQRIQELRKKQGLSQEALGEKLGVSRQAISRWEMDGAVPEVDKLIALSKLFGVSLDELLQVEVPKEAALPQDDRARRDRELIRWLAGLCAALILVSAVSLGFTIHFRRQVMDILDPPQAPVWPASDIEYAFLPDYESMTVDVAFSLADVEELKGWEVSVRTRSYERLSGTVTTLYDVETPVTLRRGAAAFCLEDIPFSYHGLVNIILTYSKGKVSSSQPLFSAEPTGPGIRWEVRPIDPIDTEGIIQTETPELLEPQ